MSAVDEMKARAVEVLRDTCCIEDDANQRILREPRKREAERILAALAAAGLLADPDALARAKAEAWAEGKAAGCSGRSDRDEWLAGLGPRSWPSENPYLRADRIDPTEGETS